MRRDLAALLRVLADLGARHADDVMPDFTYLQHAQPTTLGHFLLGFAAPLRRDAERLALEAALLDESARRRRQHQRRAPAARPRAHARPARLPPGERPQPRRDVARRRGDQR